MSRCPSGWRLRLFKAQQSVFSGDNDSSIERAANAIERKIAHARAPPRRPRTNPRTRKAKNGQAGGRNQRAWCAEHERAVYTTINKVREARKAA
jgi:hypothetical protein